MSRSTWLAAVLAIGSLMIAMAPAAASTGTGSGPIATAAKSCKVGDYASYGTTYVRSISARNVSCRRAREIVRAFHQCRKGARGRCHRRVEGYRCSEDRNVGVGSFDSKVLCRRGGKRVRHAYTQFT
jgi:hypothetical protein